MNKNGIQKHENCSTNDAQLISQLQRIGIARALYKKSKILILDEATSSLDEKTEMKIIEEIFSFGDEITIITVTHRKENLKFCDKIINLNDYL